MAARGLSLLRQRGLGTDSYPRIRFKDSAGSLQRASRLLEDLLRRRRGNYLSERLDDSARGLDAHDVKLNQDERTHRHERKISLGLHKISVYALRKARLYARLSRRRDFQKG